MMRLTQIDVDFSTLAKAKQWRWAVDNAHILHAYAPNHFWLNETDEMKARQTFLERIQQGNPYQEHD